MTPGGVSARITCDPRAKHTTQVSGNAVILAAARKMGTEVVIAGVLLAGRPPVAARGLCMWLMTSLLVLELGRARGPSY